MFVPLFIFLFVPPSGFSGLKLACSGLQSAFLGIKSVFSELKSALSGLKSGLSGLNSALKPQICALRPPFGSLGLQITHLKPKPALSGFKLVLSGLKPVLFLWHQRSLSGLRSIFSGLISALSGFKLVWLVSSCLKSVYREPSAHNTPSISPCQRPRTPLWGRCPATPDSNSLSCKAGQRVSLTTYCSWATCSLYAYERKRLFE